MWIIIRSGNISQKTFSNKTSMHNCCWSYDLLSTVTTEVKWITVNIYIYAIHINLLADIPSHNIRVIAVLFEIIILFLGRTISQIKCFGNIRLNDLFIGIKREEIIMKHVDMISDLNWNIVFSV